MSTPCPDEFTYRALPADLRESGNSHLVIRDGKCLLFDAASVYLWEIAPQDAASLKPGSLPQACSLRPISVVPCRQKNYEHQLKARFAPAARSNPSITLNITHACNLNCSYCFAAGGQYGGAAKLMSPETVRASLDFALRHYHPKTIKINFFGGEPLLNCGAIKETLRYAETIRQLSGVRFEYSMSTNGTLDLSPLLEELIAHNIRISVSIDGSREVHNRNRPFKSSGEGSYDAIVKNLGALFKKVDPRNISAKITSSKEDINSTELIKSVLALGFKNILITKQLLYSATHVKHSLYSREDYSRLLDEYDETLKWYVNELNSGSDLVLQPLHKMMYQVLAGESISYQCLAGSKLICIDPEGDIYPCHRFAGEKDWRLGSVNGGEYKSGLAAHLLDKQLQGWESCRRCWARFLCFGNHCHQQNILQNKDLSSINEEAQCAFMQGLQEKILYYSTLIADRKGVIDFYAGAQ